MKQRPTARAVSFFDPEPPQSSWIACSKVPLSGAVQSAAIQHQPRHCLHHCEVESGSKPLFLIAPDARTEARNAINLLAPSISFEPATTAAENV